MVLRTRARVSRDAGLRTARGVRSAQPLSRTSGQLLHVELTELLGGETASHEVEYQLGIFGSAQIEEERAQMGTIGGTILAMMLLPETALDPLNQTLQ